MGGKLLCDPIRWPSVASMLQGVYTLWNLLVVKQVKDDDEEGVKFPATTKEEEETT